MTPITRRSFAFSGLAAALAAPGLGKLAVFGLQLYTVRRIIGQDPARVLKEIEAAGYKEVETAPEDLPKIWPALQQTKLKLSACTCHRFFSAAAGPARRGAGRGEKTRLRVCHLPVDRPQGSGRRGGHQEAGGSLNKAGEQATAAGLKLCYHNHAFEFAPAGGAGGMVINVLMANTEPKHVGWEMDIFWVGVTGHDPVDLLRKYPQRVALMHVKDLAAGVAQRSMRRSRRRRSKKPARARWI